MLREGARPPSRVACAAADGAQAAERLLDAARQRAQEVERGAAQAIEETAEEGEVAVAARAFFLPLSSDPRQAHVCIKQHRVKRMKQQQKGQKRGKREVRVPQKMPRLEIKRNTTPTSKQKPNSDTDEASHR